MKTPCRYLIMGLSLLLTPLAWAQSGSQYSLGAKLDFATWGGDNPAGGKSFEAGSTLLGLTGQFRYQRWFAGLTLLGGDFEFTAEAPARPTRPLPAGSEPVTIKRSEVDLVLGYQFWRRVGLFLDLKSVGNEWLSDGYTVNYLGLGLGVNGHLPLSPAWTLFGNVGIVPMRIEAEGEKVGNAGRGALNVGLLYRTGSRMGFSIGLQVQSQTNAYDDGTEQTHVLGALRVGVNGSF